jgi:DNA-binding CsgD family transcriptional regulator
MKQTTEEKILDKLDNILRVLSLNVGSDKSITERVKLLKLAGLDNKTIAEVLNTSQEAVRALFSQSKRKNKS